MGNKYDSGAALPRPPPTASFIAHARAPSGPDFEAAGPDFEAAGPDFEAAGPDLTDVPGPGYVDIYIYFFLFLQTNEG